MRYIVELSTSAQPLVSQRRAGLKITRRSQTNRPVYRRDRPEKYLTLPFFIYIYIYIFVIKSLCRCGECDWFSATRKTSGKSE